MQFSRFLPTARTAKPAPVAATPAPTAAEIDKARIKAIFALDGAADMIRHLALDTDLSVEQATAVLATAPKPGPARATIAERVAAAGNLSDLGTMPRATAASGDGWGATVARVNAAHGFPIDRPGVSTTVPGMETMAGQPAPISARMPRAEAATAAPAAPAAPATAAPEGAPAYNYPHASGVADDLTLAERLPAGRPRDTFRRLGDQKGDLHVALMAIGESRDELRERRHPALRRVRELTDATYQTESYRQNLYGDDEPMVQMARKKLAAIDDELARLNGRYEAAQSKWEQAARLYARASRYLQETSPGALKAWSGKPVAPKAGEPIERAATRARETLARLHADLHEIKSAPVPVGEAWPAIAAEVERLAEAGRPDVLRCLEQRDVQWPEASAFVQQAGVASPAHGRVQVNDGFALSMWLNKGPLLKRLEAELRAGADDAAAISTEDRRKREAELRAAILEAERVDIDLVQAAAGAVEHRPAAEIDSRALLGIEGPAPREDA